MRFAVYPYKTGSNSAKSLASALNCKIVKHHGSHYQKYSTPGWWTINWGSDHCPGGSRVLNGSLNLSRTRDKLKFFNLVKEYCRVPEYTTSKETAATWFTHSKSKVVCRQTLTGHSGQGIVVVNNPAGLVSSPLYTRYVPKDTEWRLHFIQGRSEPFFIQRKARRQTGYTGEYNTEIRNLAGGYVYVHDATNVGTVPKDVLDQSSAAFGHSGLDFGAIDVIYNNRSGKAYVLEVNSAPGLEGATIQAYADVFKELTT